MLLHLVTLGDVRGPILMALFCIHKVSSLKQLEKRESCYLVSVLCASYVRSSDEGFSSTTCGDMGFIYGIYIATPCEPITNGSVHHFCAWCRASPYTSLPLGLWTLLIFAWGIQGLVNFKNGSLSFIQKLLLFLWPAARCDAYLWHCWHFHKTRVTSNNVCLALLVVRQC